MSDLALKEITLRGAGGQVIVDQADLVVESGESVALIGESGAGKTSLALAIMGLWPGTSEGAMLFRDRRLDSTSEADYRALRGRELVYMPQDPAAALSPTMTVGAALSDVLRFRAGLNRTAARESAISWLDRVGLSPGREMAGRYPYQLSGGMAQRVLMAKALACEPQLLIADEPFSSLDPDTAFDQIALLQELQVEGRFSLLLITHDLGLARRLATKVVVMRSGRVVESGPLAAVFNQPKEQYTAELIAAGLPLSPGEGV